MLQKLCYVAKSATPPTDGANPDVEPEREYDQPYTHRA